MNPQGNYDDWIELKNITDETIDLSGMYMSDKLENPLKWKIPEGTQLEPNGYLMIWADEDSSTKFDLHTNFKLSTNGETILLFDTDERGNALLDSVTFGNQTADLSFGRSPDASGTWQILSQPTPGAKNEFSSLVSNYAAIPNEVKLLSAYPNPFNPSTTISFSIPTEQKVTLTIFDVLGQEVVILVDGVLPAGQHSLQWQAKNMASGIYLYQLRVNSITITQKMLLIK
jgi:hypothetical protein